MFIGIKLSFNRNMYRIYVALNICLRLFKVVDDLNLQYGEVFFVLVNTCSGVDGKWRTGKCRTTAIEFL